MVTNRTTGPRLLELDGHMVLPWTTNWNGSWSKFCKGKTFPLSILLLYYGREEASLDEDNMTKGADRTGQGSCGGTARGLQSARKFIPFESHPGIKSNTI